MSVDVFVQGFRNGDSAPMPSAAFHAVFGPYIDRVEPESHYHHVLAPDGGEANVYADVTAERCTSLMLNHLSGGAVLDLLARFARLADAVIMPVGRPVLLTTPGQREHLPESLLEIGTVVIANGHDIAAVVTLA